MIKTKEQKKLQLAERAKEHKENRWSCKDALGLREQKTPGFQKGSKRDKENTSEIKTIQLYNSQAKNHASRRKNFKLLK